MMRFIVILLSVLLSACSVEREDDSKPFSISKSKALKNYATARPLLWDKVYPNGGKTLYCQESFNSQQRRGYNVEHVFPMSWATNGLNCGKRKQCRVSSKQFNLIEADLHNLYPSREDVNKDRSSYRFGNVRGESRHYGKTCDFEVNPRARVAEPAPSQRGEVARAMFYMAYTYKDQGLILFKKQATLLEKWHRSDPPNAEEHRRNNVIEKNQGNRNIFIDEPSEVGRLMKAGVFDK